MATRLATLLLLSCLATACASGGYLPSEGEVPDLEQRVEQSSADFSAMARLGAHYHQEGRLDEAERLLRPVVDSGTDDAHAVLFLGMVYEDQERPGEALELYRRYLESGAPGGLTDRVEERVRLLRRQELRRAARESLEREAELADRTPEPGTVAVFPFRFAGGDEELRPLGRALAEMLTTDLGQTDRLSVLERVRVQVLLDEMALAESERVDPSTAARSGRLLGAGRIVQGQLEGDEEALRIEAAVVDVGEDDPQISPVSREDEVARLPAMQADLALEIYDAMGVSLTPAERERVAQTFTDNLQALLAYGRGLEAVDAGRYGEAQDHFQEAVSLDPDFDRAAQDAEEASDLASASGTSTAEVARAEVGTALDVEVFEDVQALTREAGARDPAQELLGTEGVAGSSSGGTTIELFFPPPPESVE